MTIEQVRELQIKADQIAKLSALAKAIEKADAPITVSSADLREFPGDIRHIVAKIINDYAYGLLKEIEDV